jgi:hypothetical protein
LLVDHHALLRAVAEALLDEETLGAARIREIAEGHGVAPSAIVAVPA